MNVTDQKLFETIGRQQVHITLLTDQLLQLQETCRRQAKLLAAEKQEHPAADAPAPDAPTA